MRFRLVFLLPCIPFFACAQEEKKLLDDIGRQLSNGSKSVTEVLTDRGYMSLHSSTAFREIIRKNAKQEKITLVDKQEPGHRATIKGRLMGGKTVSDLLVYVYHTDNRGWYADTGAHVLIREGDRGHARLFGYLMTDNNGQFEFVTIHPQGYPRSDLPQHIHLEVYDKNGTNLLVTELLFDDDTRLQGETRRRALQEGFVVAKNVGSQEMQVYSYSVSIR